MEVVQHPCPWLLHNSPEFNAKTPRREDAKGRVGKNDQQASHQSPFAPLRLGVFALNLPLPLRPALRRMTDFNLT